MVAALKAATSPKKDTQKMKKSRKEYKDYGEYLEDAYEEWCDLADEQRMSTVRSAKYGPPSNRLTITEYNGELISEWNREKN